jgi:hypothetical protein
LRVFHHSPTCFSFLPTPQHSTPVAEPASTEREGVNPLLGPHLVRGTNEGERAARKKDRRAARDAIENAIDQKVPRRRLGAQRE